MSVSLTEWPQVLATLARTYGSRGILLRTVFEMRRRTARFRAEPAGGAAPATGAIPSFMVDAEPLQAATDHDVALERAERVLKGEYQAFRYSWRPLPRDSAAWLRHPETAAMYDAAEPWWRVRHLDPVRGDIKLLWEPARFAWAYDLVRGYLITGDDRYAAAFHARLAEWDAACVPFRGPHWSCGQETAIRAAALLYAEANLRAAPSSTPEVLERLARILAHSAERIDDAIGYAISQRNNHGISEATGLVLLGLRFRGKLPQAEAWLARGKRWLERLIPEQFAPDGWYIQHSFNYMRVALDQCVLAQRALRAADSGLSTSAVDRLRAATGLLGWVMEPTTGVVPNHGANDGAFVHPITVAGYTDFRPVLTAVCATFGHPLPADVGADAEVLAWLGAAAPAIAPAPRGVRVGESGWAAARVGSAALFVRAGRYDSRPGHSDALHADVRFGARQLVVDPGTYSYNAPPLDRAFASAVVHNGPLPAGRDWGVRGARFLWLRWPSARIASWEWDGEAATIVAEVPGRVQRSIHVDAGAVRIEDRRVGGPAEPLGTCWLLHPAADPAAATFLPAALPVAAAPDRAAGWFSAYYGDRVEAPAFAVQARAPDDVLISIFKASAVSAAAGRYDE